MSVARFLPVAEIRRRPDARPLDEGAVRSLAESISTIGLLAPITVRPVPGGFEVLAGAHRLAAHKLLGEREILTLEAEHARQEAQLGALNASRKVSDVTLSAKSGAASWQACRR